MNISEMLGEYERDYALAMLGVEDFPYQKLSGKTIVVDGESEYMKLTVCMSLLALNDKEKLSIKVLMLGNGNELSEKLAERNDFSLCSYEQAAATEYNFFISTGICGLELNGTSAEYCRITNNFARAISTAKSCLERCILLSDYRVYGELERGLVISENEAGFVPFSNKGDMSQTTAVSIETYFSAYAKQFNLPTIILRSGILLGAKAELPKNFTDEIFSSVAEGKQISLPNTRKKYSFTYLNEVIHALLYAFYEFKENSVFNVISRNATVSVGMLASMIYDIYPEFAKIELAACEDDPYYGTAMNNAMIVNSGCEPLLELSEIIQLCVKSRQTEEPFGYDASHEGKMVNIQNVLVGS